MRKSVLIPSLLVFLTLQPAYGGDPSSAAVPPQPVVSYAAYLGSGTGSANAVAMDSSGHIYVVGTTASNEFVLGSSSTLLGGKTDVFVSQISQDGPTLLFFSSLVGSAENQARGMAIDSAGNIYITGTTHSADFPTRNALQPFCSVDTSSACSGDAFVAKFDAQGTLVYSTYLGGSGNDVANGIAVDASGNVYITGTTDSTDFPVIGAFQWVASGKGDAFVAKIAADGSRLIYATYLGGSAAQEARGIAVDAAGNAYITGTTSSPDFPTKAALQTNCALNSQNVCDEAFVTQISADGSTLVFSTYIGGGGADAGNAIAVDGSGNVYVVGETLSTDFPLVKPLQSVTRGGSKAFISKLAADGSSLLYSTYLGGSGDDRGYALTVDNAGNAFVAGETLSSDFPLKKAVQTACKTDSTGACTGDAFVAVLDPSGANLEFASYFGGSGADQARGIAVDAQGAVYIAGATASSDFPFTTLAQLPSSSSGTQTAAVSSGITSQNSGGAFVAKITEVSVAGGTGTNSNSNNDKKTANPAAPITCLGATNWLGGTGNWSNAAKWSTGIVPNSSTATVCIDNGNSVVSQVTLDINVSVGGLVIDANDSLTVGNGITLLVAGGISNSGQILLNGLSSNTFLQIATGQNVSLTGGGTVTMSNTGRALINQQTSGGGSILTNVDNTIQGAGQIGWDGLALVNQATINANVTSTTVGLTLNAPAVTNAGLIEATNGGLLVVTSAGQVSGGGGTPIVNNAGGMILANGSGSSAQFANATIQGGTLNTVGGGVLGTATNYSVTLDGGTQGPLNNAGTYTAATISTTILVGTINNTGTLLINAANSTTTLQIATGKNVTLTGGGTVTMSNSGWALINQQGAGSTLTNVNNTIQGTGQIGWNGLALVNQAAGIINANFTSTTVGLGINAPVVTNAGLIEATNGGLLVVTSAGQVSGGGGPPIVNNAGGMILANGSGSSVQFASATIQGGTLNTLDNGVLGTATNNSATLDGSTHGTLTNTGTYTAATISTTILVGTINNTGTLLINAANSTTTLQVATGQNVSLTGGGTVTMSNTGWALINQQTSGGGSILTNVDNTIQGAGQIGWDGLVLVNQGTINANVTSATVGLTLNAPAVTNTGVIEATNGGLLGVTSAGQVSGGGGTPIVNNAGGTIVANGNGSSVQFANATIQGGTLNTVGGGVLGTATNYSVTLDGNTQGPLNNAGTYTAATISTTILVGTINNTGTLLINAANSTTTLQIATGKNVTLTGGGTVTMSNSGRALINQQGAGSTLTNVNNTIQGTGQIGWNGLALVNQAAGIINANFTSTTVGLWINAPTVTNTGLIEATNGGLLLISQYGGGVPTVNNAGGMILANGSGSSVQFANATIQGGTLNTLNNGVLGTATNYSATLDGSTHGTLTNTGTYTAATISTTVLVGTINNTGGIQITSLGGGTFLSMAAGQNVTLTGTGTVTLNGGSQWAAAIIQAGAGSTLTNAGNTIQGQQGQIGWNGLAVVNNGTLLPTSLAINGSAFTNNGTVQVNNGSTLSVSTTNSLMTNAGNVTVNPGGTMTVTGTYTQSAGGSQIDGAFTATTVNINGGTLFGNGGTITGPTSLAGVLRPGDIVSAAGALNISGTYSQAAAGAYNLVIGGLSPGSQFGQVNITSAASLNGTLNGALINGFNPVAGNSFTFMNSGSLTGTFAATNLPALACGGSWQVSYTSTSAVLSVVNPAPTISSLSPSSAVAGESAFPLTVNGSGFVCGSTASFNGNARTTTFVSPTQLTVAVLASDIATAGLYNVRVSNPSPGGGTSNAVSFTVNNPVPAITTLSPSSTLVAGSAFSLTVNGTGFVSTSTVSFNGNARTTTFVSATQLTAAIPASDIATTGTYNVTVTNPAPGGGTSNAVTFTVNNPVPTISTISPTSAVAGGAAFTLTVNGTNFISSSTVNFNGHVRTTTFVSATQLTAAIPASDIATGGTYNVTVTNPAPGGGTSNAAVFTVNNPLPTISTISPTSAVAGGAAFTLTVNGTNFVSTSAVSFNGHARTTTFASATQLTAAILATDIASAGTYNVTVSNPAPGGGGANGVTFTVSNPTPTISTISPTSVVAGGAAFTLTLNGTNFISTSTVNFNGNARTTTYVSATQLTAAIPASDIATAGTYNVTVTNPSPGGGASNAVTFTVTNPVPTIGTISPTNATAGGAAFTLTVNGTNLLRSSTVNFNGNARTTNYVSATQLTAAIPASDITTAGTYNVTVTNPSPGGGTSNAVTFTVNNPALSITSLSPSSAAAGGTAFTLTVNGTGYLSGSTVKFNGNARTTTYVSTTQLTAAILASDIATAGTYNVTVTNPPPGGGTSNAVTFTVNNPVPTIGTISPTSATAGGAAFTLTVNGTNFVSTSTVNFNGNARTTTFVSATQLTAAILASDIATGGTFTVTVTNPSPGGGTSNIFNFTVNNPAPTISTISPTSAVAGGAAFTLTVSGTNFVRTSTANFNGNARTTTFVSPTQLTATILATDIATGGTYNVTVTNPAPGGGASNAATFAVNNPVPTITTLSPSSATAGGAAFTLTVNGTNFVGTSTVNFNGNARTTTFASATQLTAVIPASDIATAGTYNVTVTNPSPGGGMSASAVFVVSAVNAIPSIASASPNNATAGGSAFTLTVNGTNFVSSSTVNFNGNARTTIYVSATQLTAAILASDIVTGGTYNVTVTNPAPGGGTSNPVTFTVNNLPPTIATISPSSATAGSTAFNLTVNGTNFVGTSTVNFNGNVRTTTFISATQLTAAISASDIATAGTYNVTVTNPSPGGGTSAPVSFTVSNPLPAITNISPTSTTAGGAAFTLTVNGTNFVGTSTVNFNGNARTTTFVSPTQLTAAILATDIASGGTYNVTVTNPSPGGGTSNVVNFTVNNPVPTITTLSPSDATTGGAAFTLTVSGTNFLSTSTVKFNGNARTTAFVSTTQLTAAILASDIATDGTYNVTVTNPSPGGGTSAPAAFIVSVQNPVPTVTTLSPSSATAGGAAFTLTVNGTGFVSSSTVNFNGNGRTTTFVSATQLTAAIPASDIATAGTHNVTVTSPSPGGGTSNAVTFTVNSPVPAITTISPSSAMVGGSAFTLTVNGTSFVSTSAVNFNGNTRTTTFVSATQLTAAIPASDVATAGTYNVTVTNASPGGGTSNAVSFQVRDFSLTVANSGSTSQTVTAGQSATYNLQIMPANGFTGPVTLTCSGAPSLATCTAVPSSLAVNGNTPFTVSVATTAPSSAVVVGVVPPSTPWRSSLAVLLGGAMLTLLGTLIIAAQRPRHFLAPVSATIALALLVGCGGGGFKQNPSEGTPKGTYTLTVTGAYGGADRTITLTLTVN